MQVGLFSILNERSFYQTKPLKIIESLENHWLFHILPSVNMHGNISHPPPVSLQNGLCEFRQGRCVSVLHDAIADWHGPVRGVRWLQAVIFQKLFANYHSYSWDLLSGKMAQLKVTLMRTLVAFQLLILLIHQAWVDLVYLSRYLLLSWRAARRSRKDWLDLSSSCQTYFLEISAAREISWHLWAPCPRKP